MHFSCIFNFSNYICIVIINKYKIMKEESNNTKVLTGSKELQSRMPRGSITLLAQKYGVTSQYIASIISGKANNKSGIIEDAYRLIDLFEELKTVI